MISSVCLLQFLSSNQIFFVVDSSTGGSSVDGEFVKTLNCLPSTP